MTILATSTILGRGGGGLCFAQVLPLNFPSPSLFSFLNKKKKKKLPLSHSHSETFWIDSEISNPFIYFFFNFFFSCFLLLLFFLNVPSQKKAAKLELERIIVSLFSDKLTLILVDNSFSFFCFLFFFFVEIAARIFSLLSLLFQQNLNFSNSAQNNSSQKISSLLFFSSMSHSRRKQQS